MIKLLKGDCLELMKTIENGSVDAIITDPPYGTTACKWDSVIPFDLMWEQLNRIIKPNGAIVLTAQQPFTSNLIMSNTKNFRYNWVWDKGYSTGFANANKMPMKGFEDVCVFYKKLPTYNPQGLVKIEPKIKKRVIGGAGHVMGENGTEGKTYTTKYTNYPNGFIRTKKEKTSHPTGKPVALMEYLIKTYTNENETVLDFTMGSGSTGVACVNTNRNFIGIEQDENYFNIAEQRINETEYKLF
jgi:site-specific DNA-methyltransferase (adenine-specific)